MAAEFIRVFGRIRPSARGTEAARNGLVAVDERTMRVPSSNQRLVHFDGLFGGESSQECVFNTACLRVVEGCLEGYNGCIFAYGQTGSGKTHTMLGPSTLPDFFDDQVHKGLIPRTGDFIFQALEKRKEQLGSRFSFTVECKFLELYNENVYDLLGTCANAIVNVRQMGDELLIDGATSETITSLLDMMRLVRLGWEGRRTAETAMNRSSSRSHALFILNICMEEEENGVVNRRSACLNLVDLAGNERQQNTGAKGLRLKEATKINSSLTVLGRVIRALPVSDRAHVAYRDSKLTHLLKDSLGGNSRTAVIVNMRPDPEYVSESMMTIFFAEACKKVKNHAQANREVDGDSVAALRAEIEKQRERADTIEETVKRDMQRLLDDASGRLREVASERDEWRQRAVQQEKTLADLRLRIEWQSSAPLPNREDRDNGDVFRESVEHFDSSRIDHIPDIEDFDLLALRGLCEQYRVEIRDKENRIESLRTQLEAAQTKTAEALNGSICSSPLRRTSNGLQNLTLSNARERILRRRTGTNLPPPVLVSDDAELSEPKENVAEQLEVRILDLERDLNDKNQTILESERQMDHLKDLLRERSEKFQTDLHDEKERSRDLAEQLRIQDENMAKLRTELKKRCDELSETSRRHGRSEAELADLKRTCDELRLSKAELAEDLQRMESDLVLRKMKEARLKREKKEVENELDSVKSQIEASKHDSEDLLRRIREECEKRAKRELTLLQCRLEAEKERHMKTKQELDSISSEPWELKLRRQQDHRMNDQPQYGQFPPNQMAPQQQMPYMQPQGQGQNPFNQYNQQPPQQ